MILEPLQNAGGCIPPQDGYFQRVREICDGHDVLLVSDEVICAWGRLGHYFGCERYGYQPDIITTAKALTSAYVPMGAMIASDEVFEPFAQRHGVVRARVHLRRPPGRRRGGAGATSTSSSARTSAATCCESRASSARMLEGLRDIPIVGDVRGAGFFHAIELVKDQETKEGFTDEESEWLLRGFLSGELYRRGLICRADDRGDPVIQLAPPLICDTEHFEEIARRPAPRADRGLGEGPSADLSQSSMLTVGACSRTAGSSSPPATRAATDKPVRWVHISEHEDPTPWLSGGELLLTTGYQPRHAGEAAPLRRAARRARASPGSASAPASTTSGCPKALVDAAEAHGLPLFEVPYEMPFIAITERAAPQLVNEQFGVLERGVQVHERLERLVIEGRGLERDPRLDRGRDRRARRCSRRSGRELARSAGTAARPRRDAAAELAGRDRDAGAAAPPAPFAPSTAALAGRALAVPVPGRRGGEPRRLAGGRLRARPARRLRAALRPPGGDGRRRSS